MQNLTEITTTHCYNRQYVSTKHIFKSLNGFDKQKIIYVSFFNINQCAK